MFFLFNLNNLLINYLFFWIAFLFFFSLKTVIFIFINFLIFFLLKKLISKQIKYFLIFFYTLLIFSFFIYNLKFFFFSLYYFIFIKNLNYFILNFIELIFTILLIFFLKNTSLILKITQWVSLKIFFSFILILKSFNLICYDFQIKNIIIIKYNYLQYSFAFAIDNLSIIFLLLSCYILLFCLFTLETNTNLKLYRKKNCSFINKISLKTFYLQKINFLKSFNQLKIYCITLLYFNLLILFFFTILDLFFFFIAYESILFPILILIFLGGSRPEKKKAIYFFLIYTFIGSIPMILSIFYIWSYYGTTNLLILYYFNIPPKVQLYLWWAFFIPFSIKIPVVPFHLWLPQAHVEAPTIGSILLAALLLKLGGYGFLRINLKLMPFACNYFYPLVSIIGALSIIYISILILRQIDLKKIIAYTSIAHMNVVLLGIASSKQIAIKSSIFIMFNHGLISTGLFFCIGLLYKRQKTRLIYYFSGLQYTMPLFCWFFFLFSLANISFPGTSNFIGEMGLLFSLININHLNVIIILIGFFFSAIYSLWFFIKIFWGNPYYFYTLQKAFQFNMLNLKNKIINFKMIQLSFNDINPMEFLLLLNLLYLIFLFGFLPNLFFWLF